MIPDLPSDVQQALLLHLTLPIGEADVAIVAELLVGKNRGARFWQAPSPSSSPSPSLRLAVARVLSVGCLRFLLAVGGERERTVLRHGRRQRGRLWDAHLNVDVDPSFSPMAFSLVWNLATTVLPLALGRGEKSSLAELSRDERTTLKRALTLPARTAFDHVWCALALENCAALRLPDAVDVAVRRNLSASSPLCALLAPDDPDRADVDVAALLAPSVVRLLEVTDSAIAAAFVRSLKQIWTRSLDAVEFAARCQAFTRLLLALVGAFDAHQRLDLLGPVARLLAAVPVVLPHDARARLLQRPGVTTMADRDRVVAALQGLCDVALVLDQLRGRLQGERYGDDRYDEAQLALRVLDDDLAPHRGALATFTRALTATVG